MSGVGSATVVAMACLSAVLASACATPLSNVRRIVQAAGFEERVLEGQGFRHWSAYRPGPSGCRRLHVYLDHDGLPWRLRTVVAADPSPRDPLALRLMSLDPGPALYLGRPCHFMQDGRSVCHPLLWTHRRYGEEVVASMVQALEAFRIRQRFDELVLIGYSGGGALAMLMAPRLPQTSAAATVAANLDTSAWTALHGYSPLLGSLDPAAQPPLKPSILQTHFVGGRDEDVPPAVTIRAVRREEGARLVSIADFDHRCCWVQAWPELLARLSPERPECRRAF